MSTSALVDLFLSAVAVDAPSLHEAPMAAFVREALRGTSVRIVEDGTAARIQGTSGNLVCIPPGFDPSRPAIGLFAHLDTPRPTTGVRPIVHPDRITSDGTTILGVDDRAGVSVLLHLLRERGKNGDGQNFIVVFTVAEELGMYGAKHVNLAPYNVRMAFVFDCSKRPGVFLQSAVGCSLYTATFHGRASHAGVSPEKGIHAIRVASEAISRIPLGRLKPGMTSNIGSIRGGEATNIVPDRCTIEGEVRSFSPVEITAHLDELERIFLDVVASHGATVTMERAVDFAPFVLKESDGVYRATCNALSAIGLTPAPIAYLGGSDANMLNGNGIPTANLGVGAQNPHGNDEFILLEDLDKTYELAIALIDGGVHVS